ncbi:MAG: 6-bladed beta-propeller [Candidatus Aminicenantaceae bacterium]
MRNKSAILSVILFLSIFILLTSCGEQKAKWAGTIEEEDGITIVRNPKIPIYSEEVFQLEEDLTIISPEDDELMFQNLTTLVVDESENIYVTDTKAGHILTFDKNGDFVRTIGKRGQGPGEMTYPLDLVIMAQKELMVNDLGQAKLHFFTLEGEYLTQMTTSKYPAFRRPKSDAVGNIVVSHAIMDKPVKIFLKKIDSELNPLCEIASCVAITQPPVLDYFEILRTTSFVWNVLSTDEIIWGNFKKYEIFVCDPDGNCLRKIVKEDEGVPITKEEEKKLIKNMYGDNPVPPSITLKFPDRYPPFIHFTCDEEGRILVYTYEKTEDDERNYYDVFDSEGKFILRTTFKFWPQVWKNSMMYCVEEDEDGFEVIKRYRVNWAI